MAARKAALIRRLWILRTPVTRCGNPGRGRRYTIGRRSGPGRVVDLGVNAPRSCAAPSPAVIASRTTPCWSALHNAVEREPRSGMAGTVTISTMADPVAASAGGCVGAQTGPAPDTRQRARPVPQPPSRLPACMAPSHAGSSPGRRVWESHERVLQIAPRRRRGEAAARDP